MAQKKYKAILARRADIMMQAHIEFLARVSIPAAHRLLTDFKRSIHKIEDNPFQFSYADELDAPGIPDETYRKCFFNERYKALFIIEEQTVYIDAIIDCRQENSELF